MIIKHMKKLRGKIKNRILLHDDISEVIKTTSRTMWLVLSQISNRNFKVVRDGGDV